MNVHDELLLFFNQFYIRYGHSTKNLAIYKYYSIETNSFLCQKIKKLKKNMENYLSSLQANISRTHPGGQYNQKVSHLICTILNGVKHLEISLWSSDRQLWVHAYHFRDATGYEYASLIVRRDSVICEYFTQILAEHG